jgi:hypothetical protein
MPETVESLEAQLTALKKAKRAGVLKVEHDGKATTFRSLKDMDVIIQDLKKEIATLNGETRVRTHFAFQSGKGL